MMFDSATINRIDRVCAWLFVVPFFLMMLLPAQVMPARGADGTFVLVICTGDGPVTLADAGTDPATRRTPCDWAMGHADGGIADGKLTLHPAIYARAVPVTVVALWRPAHDTRSVTARGPPTLL
jgi:hypothetical protein